MTVTVEVTKSEAFAMIRYHQEALGRLIVECGHYPSFQSLIDREKDMINHWQEVYNSFQ
jgi:hypothetical protein